MLAASLTFHEPSSLPRPPSVPHVYVMKRKKRERESGCASVLQLNARMPTCICGCTCSQFLKGDDLFFNDRIQSGRTNFITKRFFIFTTNHVHTPSGGQLFHCRTVTWGDLKHVWDTSEHYFYFNILLLGGNADQFLHFSLLKNLTL